MLCYNKSNMAYNQRTGQGSNYVLRTGLSSFNDLDATDITSGTFDAARLPSITKSKVSNTGTWESSEIPNLSATKITSDELDEARIPELSASKITSGTLAATHIPDLSATKITSDELDADRIPNLSATKITSGTLAATHIPDVSANKITTDSLHVDRIPNLDASNPYSTISPTDAVGPFGFLCALQPNPALSFAGLAACWYPPSEYTTVVPSGSAASAASVSVPSLRTRSISLSAACSFSDFRTSRPYCDRT